jgi:hypothetical protein
VKFIPKRPISDRTDQEKEISFDWALFVLGFVVRIPCLAVHPNKDPYKQVSGVCQPNLAIPLSVTSGQNFHRNVIHELEGLTLLPFGPSDNINHPMQYAPYVATMPTPSWRFTVYAARWSI